MMMAHDKTPDRPELSKSAVDALRTSLQRFLAGDTAESLQPALRCVAEEARTKRIQAEQLLIVLKDLWFSLPEVTGVAGSDEQTRMLQRVVSLCIRAYYESS